MTATNEIHPFAMPGLSPALSSTFSLAGLCAGFDDPVHQSQQVFRRALTALSEPGTVQNVSESPAPEGANIASYQLCLALLDAETPLWIAPALRTDALVSALRFHCGCRLVDEPGQAEFALISTDFDGDLTQFAQGSHEYPDRSTTVIVQVESLDSASTWVLRGPGIDGIRKVGIAGLDPRWPGMLADNCSRFPCGVDLLFTAGTALMGLPRTTRVEI
ncbi:phosphonate C-P lyase system protein PhnH [Marinobacter sp. M3C]|uniref:phosphonate C-P lyase system protein PhnH n=1 Tax=unclassified Marinobacter TaxID=83889 RepID=UPI0020104644|nr:MULTISPECIES: phosphonate C-P lyase system protein PhnH [unclassified Marinobacter]MCL1480599.1 phosphonate C-P lyase system protein PhnH [Marinobacter sp.]MCL1484162.1 phosphonate C-P lyase system protein PhnH [Marinobacter sp.]MCL1487504.1 phosphonate C-P lyase system protein PhnH [Marinobacter sp.]UQG61079.1 phosphonate C-P lyase system protein PhnH [Marinobacter sp. M3C]UQG66533.1 phosphonate C-P lyase system protein PhnH [Marinobacter sp. M2C]